VRSVFCVLGGVQILFLLPDDDDDDDDVSATHAKGGGKLEGWGWGRERVPFWQMVRRQKT
jgi:hypothetical protein